MTLNKSQEDLFYHIRKEEVVLFVGAGFSAYAGYPLGVDLGIQLHKLLPEEFKTIDYNKSLDQFTEAIVRKCGSRDILNGLLDSIFLADPTSTADHDLLAIIHHFKTIITTNYDTLFENAYGDRANLIWLDEHVGHWDDKKVNIIKIHGHIADKSSIVLTQEDYSDFITKDFSTPLWTAVLNQIATRHILFLGYGYEDPNIWALVKKLNQRLGDSKKRMFLVSPGRNSEKIVFLESKGIEYIQHTGASFLKALSNNIEDNLIKDLETGIVSAGTARAFSRARNASLTLEDTNKGFRLKTISPVVETAETWNANFTYQSAGETTKRINSFQNSNELLEIRLNANELENFKLVFEGLKLLDHDELAFIQVKKIPKKVYFDLTFLTEGWEANGLQANIYSVKGTSRILTGVHGLEIEANIGLEGKTITGIKWDFKRPERYGTLSDEIGLYTLLLNFFAQKEFTLFLSDGLTLTSKCHVLQENNIRECQSQLNYLGWLKKIERAFGTRFGELDEIDEESWNTAKMLASILEGKRFPATGQCKLNFSEPDEGTMAYFEKLNDTSTEGPLDFFIRQDNTFLLHGQEFICKGKHVCIEYPVVDNLAAVKSGEEQALLFSSRNGKIWEQLTIEPEKQLLTDTANPEV